MIIKVPIEISARHIHLSKKDLEVLFGKGYRLKKLRELSQPLQFAAKETLDIKNGLKKISNVRIVGPCRPKTQVELSLTDAFNLGMRPPIRRSGDLKGSLGISLIGPKGELKIKEGVICPWRHIHTDPETAKKIGLKDRRMVSLKIRGKRSLVFHQVQVRVSKKYRLCVHLDTDEGNSANIKKRGVGEIIIH